MESSLKYGKDCFMLESFFYDVGEFDHIETPCFNNDFNVEWALISWVLKNKIKPHKIGKISYVI